jgi:hypothetical protein
MSDTETKIQEILEAFEPLDNVYKRETVDEAVALQQEITPHLINILKDTIAHPQAYFDRMSHIYALMLLGHFRETRAHQVILDLFSLPQPLIEPLYDDLITEDLRMVLLHTCGGAVEGIKQLILNKAAYEYCRSAAIDTLTYATVSGFVSREATLDFFSSLFTGDEAEPDDIFWSSLVSSMCDLHPEEVMPVIRKAFEDDLIDPIYIGLDYIETEILPAGKEKALARIRRDIEHLASDDIHQHMSWWAMFKPDQESHFNPSPVVTLPPRPPVKQQKKAKKKKKRKIAKVSKKKNRR